MSRFFLLNRIDSCILKYSYYDRHDDCVSFCEAIYGLRKSGHHGGLSNFDGDDTAFHCTVTSSARRPPQNNQKHVLFWWHQALSCLCQHIGKSAPFASAINKPQNLVGGQDVTTQHKNSWCGNDVVVSQQIELPLFYLTVRQSAIVGKWAFCFLRLRFRCTLCDQKLKKH